MNLTIEAKQMIVEKALNRKGKKIAEIAVAHNIGYSTLQKWIRQSREGKLRVPKQKTAFSVGGVKDIEVADKFKHLMATANLNETKIGVYCRERGLYSYQLQQWQEEFMKQDKAPEQRQKTQSDMKALKAENALLKQDIRRKDRALSEATALLILKKKADLIWGEFADV